MSIIWNILLLSVAVFVVAKFLPAIHVKNYETAVVIAIVYSVVNYLLGGLLTFLTLPFVILTFGLFKLVINAFLLWLTDKLVDDFHIDGMGTTLLAAVLITIVDSILHRIFH